MIFWTLFYLSFAILAFIPSQAAAKYVYPFVIKDEEEEELEAPTNDKSFGANI